MGYAKKIFTHNTKTNIAMKQCTLPVTELQCGHQGVPKPMSDCPGQVEI